MKRESNLNRILGIKGFWVYEFLDTFQFPKSKAGKIILFFTIIPLTLFLFPFIRRFSQIASYPWWRKFSLISAFSWSFWGPYCIYQYHTQIITLFQDLSCFRNCSIREAFQDTYRKFNRRVIIATLVWEFFLVAILVIYPETLVPYSFYGYSDFWYWAFLAYISFDVHLTACGIVGIFFSFLLLKKLIQNGLMIQLLQQSPRKLKVFGRFSFSISLYFFSGITFIPILIDYIRNNYEYSQVGVMAGIGIFTGSALLSLIYPVWIVKRGAGKSQELLLNKLEAEYIKYLHQRSHCKWNFLQELRQLNRYNSIQFVKSIKIELLDSSKIFAIFTTLIFPTLLAIVGMIIPSG